MAVPSWKQAILDKRRKQEAEEERRKKDEEAKLSAIPAWKRSIMQRKDESKARSSATKALFGPKPSSIKPQEKTPSDSKAIAKSSTETTIAKSTEEKRKVETTSQCKWSDKGKTPNGSAVVEKNFKPHAATPSREKMALRRTASSDAAASNSPSPHKTRRWPVVAPPTTLVRCSSSPRNTKREVAQEMGVPEANDPSEDSPTLNQRKETFHDQVVKTSPTVAKQQKMNPTSPLLEEKPFPAANTQTSKESVKRGSVKSLMGLFQGDRKTGNKTTVNSTARKMAIQRGEHSSEESKLISKISMASVSQVLENTAAASSPAQKAKAHLAVSVESKLPVSTSSVVSKTEHSVTSNVIPTMEFKASQEFELALRQSVSDQKEVVLEERPTEKPSMSFMMYHTKVATRSEAVTTTTTTAIQHQNRNDQFENKYASSKDDVLLSAVSSVDRSSNDTKTQWETEEDELTVTSIDDVINISDEEEQHQKMKETKSENTSRLASTSMTTEPAQSTATNLTSDISTLFEDNVVHERRSSATLTPQKQADVSGVIGDAQASSALNSATSSAQNSDSESTTSEPRRKSSLVDRSKPRVYKYK